MQVTTLLVIAVIFALLVFYMRSGQISVKEARAHLHRGAMLIDVRTPAEFGSSHLPKAVNVPLNELEASIALHAPDRGQVLLLHCHSGMRSAVARKKLLALGYTHAYNLGSLSRATEIVKSS